jgi:hypothetical protein
MLKKVMPQGEGMLDTRMLAGVAERVVEIEEVEGYSNEKWPTEVARIHGIYITSDYCHVERRQRVEFTWRHDGPTGEWKKIMGNVVYSR